MYVGRIVSIARSQSGKLAGLYRVSSRSFPNREAKILENSVAILPKPGFENDIYKNPYIAYNCLQTIGNIAIVSNGSHTDFIRNKLAAGMNMRDALASVLFNMDYEHDHLNTPRIAAIVDKDSNNGYLGIVTHQSIHIQEFELNPGDAFYVATYEHNTPCENYKDEHFDCTNAADACDYILGKGVFADLERPVTAACVTETEDGWDIAVADATII